MAALNRLILSVLLVGFLHTPAHATEFDVGGVTLELPTPRGFAHLTPDIQPMYDVSRDMLSQQNLRIATFIDEAVIPQAVAGGMPTFERFINIEVMRAFQRRKVSQSEFDELRRISRSGIEKAIGSLKDQLPDKMDAMSDRVGETLDLDVAFSISNVVPLPVHHDSDKVISNSVIINYGISASGGDTDHIVAMTSSFVHVRNRIIFVYVYGAEDDLTWTRSFSAQLIEQLLSINSSAP